MSGDPPGGEPAEAAKGSAEVLLTGGNTSTVTRVGDRVYRTAGAWTPAVHELLITLRAAGVTAVPEPFGIDALGREVLSFVSGQSVAYPLPDWLWDRRLLREAATLLRAIHDASLPLLGRDLRWGMSGSEPAEVICHNDVAPYNMAFTNGQLSGLFDFDTAAPGPRIRDLAYLAYRMVPFTAEETAPTQAGQLERARVLLADYGFGHTMEQLLPAVADRLLEIAVYTEGRAAQTGRIDFSEHAAMYRRDAQWVRSLA